MNASSSSIFLIWDVYILSDNAVINCPIVNILAYNYFKYLRLFLLEDIPVSGILHQVSILLLTCDPVGLVAFSEVGCLAKWEGGFQKSG